MRMLKCLMSVLFAALFVAAPGQAWAAKKKKPKAKPAAEAKEAAPERRSAASQSWTGGPGPRVDKDISLNILGAVVGTLGLTYEQALSRENSFTAGLDYASRGTTGNSFTILGLHGSYRWWIDPPRRLSGVFLGPNAFVYNLSWTYDWINTTTLAPKKETASGLFFGAGAEGGYQYVFNNQLLVNAGLTLGYMAGGISGVAGGPSLSFGGAYYGLLGSVGYAF